MSWKEWLILCVWCGGGDLSSYNAGQLLSFKVNSYVILYRVRKRKLQENSKLLQH